MFETDTKAKRREPFTLGLRIILCTFRQVSSQKYIFVNESNFLYCEKSSHIYFEMGRELQKKKRRSSLPKVRRKPKPKKIILNNPIIAENW